MSSNLNPTKALIFRITHRNNVPWILDHGMVCRNHPQQDPNFINIGNAELISKRSTHAVPSPPAPQAGCTLNDFVPFYFTPFSPMLLNIKSGRNGVTMRSMDEIVIFVSSLHTLYAQNIPFIFTNKHAYAAGAGFFDDLADLDKIDWPLLQSRNFKRDDNDPDKLSRYQAEALICQKVAIQPFAGIVTHDAATARQVTGELALRSLSLTVHTLPTWFF